MNKDQGILSEHSYSVRNGQKLRAVMVSYLNTLPYLQGLRSVFNESQIELFQVIPAQAALLYQELELDAALVPVAALRELGKVHIPQRPFGIGCTGAVGSVSLYADKPIQEIRTIVLDPESKTSNQLVQMLCREHWSIKPEFVAVAPTEKEQREHTAIMAIGDKTFQYHTRFSYSYDLGAEWHNWCGLPFVFAIWVFREKFPSWYSGNWEKAMDRSLEYVPAVLENLPGELRPGLSSAEYFTQYLQFELSPRHLQGMRKFLELTA